MELLGIVLWPIIGLVYVAYKLLKEDPGLRHRVFSKDTLVSLCSIALIYVPIYAIWWLSNVTTPKSEFGIKVHSTIFIGLLILYLLFLIFGIFVYPSEWFQYWLQWHTSERKQEDKHSTGDDADDSQHDNN